MLVLTRKTQEQIQIGESVVVTVLRIKGSTVRLGIEAPRQTRVMRGELNRIEAVAGASPPAETLGPQSNTAEVQVVEVKLSAHTPGADCKVASSAPEASGRPLEQHVAAVTSGAGVRYPARLGAGTLRGLGR
jgi:carbon storage regulator CsrA